MIRDTVCVSSATRASHALLPPASWPLRSRRPSSLVTAAPSSDASPRDARRESQVRPCRSASDTASLCRRLTDHARLRDCALTTPRRSRPERVLLLLTFARRFRDLTAARALADARASCSDCLRDPKRYLTLLESASSRRFRSRQRHSFSTARHRRRRCSRHESRCQHFP